MAILITIAKGAKVTQVVTANAVPQVAIGAQNLGEARLGARYPAD